MKKIYVSPVSEIYSAEMGEMICASNRNINGEVGTDGKFQFENPNYKGGPGFEGYVDKEDEDIVTTAKEFDLWGDW